MASVEDEKKVIKEGNNLLGSPTFMELENGRFKCVETGHEMLAKDKDSYSQSKRCRLGLIDFALSHNKPPLNMFKKDPLSRAKLICKLTGDTVNKNEEHIWKHINGKRFLNKLEQKEIEKLNKAEVEEEPKPNANGEKKKKKKKKKKQKVEEIISEVRESSDKGSDSEADDFWMPPVGERWDFDDGGDRWGSGSESEPESDEENGTVEESSKETEELSSRTKRMSIEIGPSSFASRKKKSRKNWKNSDLVFLKPETTNDAKGPIRRFDHNKHEWGFGKFLSLDNLREYLANDKLVLGAEVFVIVSTGRKECVSILKNPDGATIHTWKIPNFSALDDNPQFSQAYTVDDDRKWYPTYLLQTSVPFKMRIRL